MPCVNLFKAAEDLLRYPEKELLVKNDRHLSTKEEADWFIKDDRRVLEDKKMLLIEEESFGRDSKFGEGMTVSARHDSRRVLRGVIWRSAEAFIDSN